MTTVHPTAVVDRAARLGSGVSVGPFCIVGPQVELGDNVALQSHVVIAGHTAIGARTQVFPFAVLGAPPQHLRHAGEPTRLVIGNDNIIRESVTMHAGTVFGGGVTTVGDRNFFMVNTHVGHDCRVGSGVVMANGAVLGGHVTVGDNVIFGGNCAVHQFVRIGRGAMISGVCGVADDIIPFGYAFAIYNNRASLGGLNLVGLKRRGVARDQIHALRGAYRRLFGGEGAFDRRLDAVAQDFRDNETVMEIVAFIRDESSRSLCLPTTGRSEAA